MCNLVRQIIAPKPCRLRVIGALLILLLLGGWDLPQSMRSPTLTVYVFLSTECPISQQYNPTLIGLHRQFGPLGVRFVAMFPLHTDSPRVIQQFRTEYGLPFAGQPDPDARLARQFRVRVTPEVVVMQADGKVRYQGAIDDWYVALGKHRPEVIHAYLRDALDALLSGHPVAQPRTDAVGCLIE